MPLAAISTPFRKPAQEALMSKQLTPSMRPLRRRWISVAVEGMGCSDITPEKIMASRSCACNPAELRARQTDCVLIALVVSWSFAKWRARMPGVAGEACTFGQAETGVEVLGCDPQRGQYGSSAKDANGKEHRRYSVAEWCFKQTFFGSPLASKP